MTIGNQVVRRDTEFFGNFLDGFQCCRLGNLNIAFYRHFLSFSFVLSLSRNFFLVGLSGGLLNLVHCACAVVQDIQLIVIIFGKADDRQTGVEQFLRRDTGSAVCANGKYSARNEIAKDIPAYKVGDAGTSVHVAAGHRPTHTVIVFGDGVSEGVRTAGCRTETVRAFANIPTVVLTRLYPINLLPAALPDVTCPQGTRL